MIRANKFKTAKAAAEYCGFFYLNKYFRKKSGKLAGNLFFYFCGIIVLL